MSTILRKMKLTNHKYKASWERVRSDAMEVLELQRHLTAGWVTIVVDEFGAKSRKTAFFTLDEEQVKTLREFLS